MTKWTDMLEPEIRGRDNSVRADEKFSNPLSAGVTGRRVKIAYIIDEIDSDLGGTEKQVLETLKRLDRRTYDPSLICLNSTPWLDGHHVPCRKIVLNYGGFLHWRFPGFLRKFRRLLVEERVDILQAFFEDSLILSFLGTRGLRKPPVVIASRRDIGLGRDRPWSHVVYEWMRPRVMRQLDGVLTNGYEVKRFLLDKCRLIESQIHVIHNGIDLPTPSEDRPEVFSRHRADVWIGMVANLHGRKRHAVLVDALARLREMAPHLNFKCLFLGDGDEESRLRAQVRGVGLQDHVLFEGSVDNVPAYLQWLDIGVLCSEVEGFSNAVMEYMVHSLPVVATDIGGNRELVDEDSGILVPVDDAVSMADAIGQLALNPELRGEMGRQSRKRIEGLCSWEKVLVELDEYYASLLESKTR